MRANDSRLGQVFLNLLVNAAQSIREGEAEKNQIRLSTGLDSTGYVFVEVEDTGSGMTQRALDHLFEPFFTTKPSGTGTGLGLSICRRIVHEFGGTISVQSELQVGTKVRVTLPTADAPEARAGQLASRSASRRGRVLLIDDEPLVGKAVQRALKHEHDVTMVATAVAALQELQAGAIYDLIICDMMMPMMTGTDFYKALLEMRPEQAARVVFLTGGAFTSESRAFLQTVPNRTIHKPFDTNHLRELVNEWVDPEPGTARALPV